MARATSASPAPASTVSPGSSSARRSATSTGVRERPLVVREPVEDALADDGDDDLDDVVLVQLGVERCPEILDGADDENVASARSVAGTHQRYGPAREEGDDDRDDEEQEEELRQRQATGDGQDDQDQDDEPQHGRVPSGVGEDRGIVRLVRFFVAPAYPRASPSKPLRSVASGLQLLRAGCRSV